MGVPEILVICAIILIYVLYHVVRTCALFKLSSRSESNLQMDGTNSSSSRSTNTGANLSNGAREVAAVSTFSLNEHSAEFASPPAYSEAAKENGHGLPSYEEAVLGAPVQVVSLVVDQTVRVSTETVIAGTTDNAGAR
ncbi:hypothetical protein RvY_17263 [Ramazzottius varieornatus]|uniref:Uncharacterized protein n=1 Tax=Ramazzottius varieornatus TaxID=947166 RepID=A0A1D1W5G7_RAMVA|nr:hypothetical protein RvY_17263 [Ramazzottius varieornatus]